MRNSLIRITGLVAILSIAPACGDDDGGNQNNVNQNQTNPVCGDGVIGTGETCDDGPDNSDVAPDACRTTCRAAFCGDGVIDSGEICDDGPDNSDIIPGACRHTCVEATCGDGIVDPDEECDRAALNADAPGQCRTTCDLPACGDGIVDPGEVCYGYAGVAAPAGLLLPVDVDGDGSIDLAGYAFASLQGEAMPQGFYEVARGQAQGFATGQLYLAPRIATPVSTVGQLAGPQARPVHVMGLFPTVIAAAEADGRLSLPSVFRARSQTGTGTAPLPIPIMDAAGGRWVATMDLKGQQLCTIPVDDRELFVQDEKQCFYLPLEAGSDDNGWFLRGVSLPTQDQSLAFLVGPKSGAPGNQLIRVSGQDTTFSQAAVSYGFSLVQRSAGSQELPTLARFEQPSSDADWQLQRSSWNPATAAFDTTSTEVLTGSMSSVDPGCRNKAFAMAKGRFGGAGAATDLLIVFASESMGGPCRPVLLRENAASAYETTSCAESFDPGQQRLQGMVVADLDANGEDDVAMLYGHELTLPVPAVLRILWNPAQNGCTSSTLETLPWNAAGPDAVDLDGNGRDELIVTRANLSTQPSAHDAALIRFAAGGMEIELLTAGAALGDLRAFPARPGAGNQPGLLGVTTDGAEPAVVLLRGQGASVATGRWVKDAAGEPLERWVVHSLTGDVDGDAQDDLLLIDATGTIHVYYGPVDLASGRFADHATVLLPDGYPGYAILADVDGVPGVELLTLVGNPIEGPEIPDDTVKVYRFGLPAAGVLPYSVNMFHPGIDPRLIDVADLDGDGLGDVVAVHGLSSLVTVTLNPAATPGEFPDDPASETLLPGFPVTVSAIDLDNDGIRDAVVSLPDAGLGPLLLRGLGDGTLAPPENLELSASTFGVWPCPSHLDGSKDLVLVRFDQSLRFNTLLLGATP